MTKKQNKLNKPIKLTDEELELIIGGKEILPNNELNGDGEEKVNIKFQADDVFEGSGK